jgi:hypothetical protein
VKSKISHIRVVLENGEVIEHSGGMFNQSRNYRTAGRGSPKIVAEWWEHVITWHTAIETPITVGEKELEPEHHKEAAWCNQHKMPPGDCFRQHVPATAFARALDEEVKQMEKDHERWKKEFAKPLLQDNTPDWASSYEPDEWGLWEWNTNGNSRSY